MLSNNLESCFIVMTLGQSENQLSVEPKLVRKHKSSFFSVSPFISLHETSMRCTSMDRRAGQLNHLIALPISCNHTALSISNVQSYKVESWFDYHVVHIPGVPAAMACSCCPETADVCSRATAGRLFLLARTDPTAGDCCLRVEFCLQDLSECKRLRCCWYVQLKILVQIC